MHTRAEPRRRLQDPDLDGDITAEVLAFLRERMPSQTPSASSPSI
jgi:hypothetical protein